MMRNMYQLNQIPSETQIKKYIRRVVFGKNVFCPVCRSRSVARYGERYRCCRCRLKFSLVSHTWLRGTRLSYQALWLLLWCWTAGVPVKQAAALSTISRQKVYAWYGRFRSHLPETQLILKKTVQLDEAFFRQLAVMAAKERGQRRCAAMVLPGHPQKQHVWRFVREYVAPRSRLHTDGGGHYRKIDQWWPVRHRYERHAKWEFALTSEIEGWFGNLRTFIRRMYHHVTPEKLPEVVSEFCLRFSSPEIFENPRFYLEKSLTLVPTR